MKMVSPIRTGLLLVLLLSVCNSCKRQRIKRNYTGDYQFTVNSNSWYMSSGTNHSDFDYAGKIEIGEKDPDGFFGKEPYIKIYYQPSGYLVAAIDEDGNFNFPTGGGGKFTGEDQLDFVYARRQLSSSIDDTVHAVRR